MTREEHKNLKLGPDHNKSGTVTWQSPSNIAIIKYWGKRQTQLPQNPNLSLTLQHAQTITTVDYQPARSEGVSMSFLFEGRQQDQFYKRLKSYLTNLIPIFPFIEQLHFDIRSKNTFPHSSGIASSASSMSALALCLCTIEHRLFGTLDKDFAFRKKASYVARLGSGSASRSVYARAALWGKTVEYDGSDDHWAVGLNDILHPSFQTAKNRILIIREDVKSVSSATGHTLMQQNPYAAVRYITAKSRLNPLLTALQEGDWKSFGIICEQEALDLHALMMTSYPSYILIEPNTLEAIKRIRQFRKASDLPMYFTLDAGPNVHVLYPTEKADQIENFMNDHLVGLCQRGQYIQDSVGDGPKQV